MSLTLSPCILSFTQLLTSIDLGKLPVEIVDTSTSGIWNEMIASDLIFSQASVGSADGSLPFTFSPPGKKFTLPKSFNLILVFLWIDLLNEQLI